MPVAINLHGQSIALQSYAQGGYIACGALVPRKPGADDPSCSVVDVGVEGGISLALAEPLELRSVGLPQHALGLPPGASPVRLRSAFDALLAFESLSGENAYNARAAGVYAFGLLQTVREMREVEVVILFPVEAQHVMANPLSCPVLGMPVPVAYVDTRRNCRVVDADGL